MLFRVVLVGYWALLAFAREFNPYADNSGTVVGLAGRDFCILAADTRFSEGYFIRSRSLRRVHVLDDDVKEPNDESSAGKLLFGASGCLADSLGLIQAIKEDILRYRWENDREISLRALSHLLSTSLYSRRTFPYYSQCVIAGMEEVGSVYRFDSVGSFERVCATCAGKGEQLIQPVLDEAVQQSLNSANAPEASDLWKLTSAGDAFVDAVEGNAVSTFRPYLNLNIDEACALVVKAFQAAAEREITIGDGVEIFIVSANSTDGDNRRNARMARRFAFLPRH